MMDVLHVDKAEVSLSYCETAVHISRQISLRGQIRH